MLFENLEPRLVLASSVALGVAAVPELTITGDTADNDLRIWQSGNSLLIMDPDGVTAASAGVIQTGPDTVSVTIASLQVGGQVVVDTLDGSDTVTFGALDIESANLKVSNAATVSVEANAAVLAAGGVDLTGDTIHVLDGATISTRAIASGDPLSAASTGDSSELRLFARTICVQPGVSLLAQVESGSLFQPGDVRLLVESDSVGLPFIPQVNLSDIGITVGDSSGGVTILGGAIEIEAMLDNDITLPKRVLGFTSQTAEIKIEHATIQGESVSIVSKSEDSSLLEELPEWATANLIDPALEFITDKFLPKTPIAAMYRKAEARVTVQNTQITADEDVTINASTIVDASTTAVAAEDEIFKFMPHHLSAGYSQATATSETTISGVTTITSGGTVTIGTDAATTAAVVARTTSNVNLAAPANRNDLVVSLAITNSDSTSLVTIDQGVTVMADGNINVSATGAVVNKAASAANTYVDGLGGISVSLAFDNSNVKAVVDGQLNASGVTVTRDLDISGVDGQDNTITIPDHGFDDGQRIEYFARDPANPDVALNPIGGLLDGETLRVIVIDANTIQLARTTALDIDNAGADATATETLARRASVIFDPQTTVNTANDTITLADHGFTAGQRLDYGVGGPDDDAIGGLVDQNSYFVIPTGTDTFQLAATADEATAATPTPIDLTSTGVGNGHIVAYDEPSESFNPVNNVDADANTFTLPSHGYTTGDGLAYRTDPNVSSQQKMSRTAVFNSADQTNTFDPTGAEDLGEQVVNLSTNTIALVNHGLNTGDEVTYQTNGGDPIDGLTDGSNYFVIKVDDRYIQLALTAADATAATAIDLEAGATLGASPQQLVTTTGTPRTIDFDPTGTVPEPVVNTVEDTLLIVPTHDLVGGQRVTYSAGGGTPIGGLADGVDYFAIPLSVNTIRLATTRAAALAGSAIDLTAGATGTDHAITTNDVDTLADLIVSPAHELETGQQVTYFSGNGAAIGNLTDDTVYFAIRLDANTVQLATSLGNASSGTAIDLTAGAGGTLQALRRDTTVTVFNPSRTAPVVDTAADTLELIDHGLNTGDQVNYQTSGGTAIGGLANNTDYFVIKMDDNHIQFAASAADATSGAQLNLTAGAALGSGLQTLRVIPTVSIPEFPDRVIAFNPTVAPPLDTAANTITLVNHGLTTGESITYQSGSGDPIGGLANGTEYFVIAVDDNTIQLAASAADATSGTPINLSAGATGDRHGIERLSTVTQGDVGLRGLTNGETYFAIVLDNNTIRLAPSEQDALAAVAIDLDPSVATGSVHELNPLLHEDGILVAADLTADNRATAGAGLGSTPTWSDLLTKAELQTSLTGIKNILGVRFDQAAKESFEKAEAEGTGTTTNGLFSGAAGLGLNIFDHDVLAQVGTSAVLQSDGDVKVNASASQKAQVTAQGNTSPGSAKKFATGIAVSLGFYDNNVQSIVDGDGTNGATIDALGQLDVTAELAYPLLVEPLELAPFSSFYTGDPDEFNVIDDLSSLLNGSLGLTRIMNVWSASKVFTTNSANLPKVSFSGSLGFTEFTNQSQATVRSGARLNQNQQAATQEVRVEASTGIELVNVTGIMHLKLNEAGLKKAFEDRQQVSSFFGTGNFFSFFGNKSSTLGVGGSALVMLMDNQTTAKTEDGAVVHTGLDGGLTVEAGEDIYSLEFAQSGGDSGSIGISGSLSFVDQSSNTIAQLESGVTVTGGPVTVTSESQITHTNIAGSAQLAKRLGIGVGVALLDVDRQTAAIVGRKRTENDDSPGTAGTSINVSGLTIEAKNDGNLWSFGLVGALASNIPVGKPVQNEAEAEPVKATSGVALAGDAGINTVNDVTQAYINDTGTIVSGAVDLNSSNGTSITVFTGAASFAAKPNGTIGGAVAGSFSYNTLTLSTESFIAGAQLTASGDVSVQASNDGSLLAVSAGLAGALAKSAVTIAGSFSWNEITNSVQSYLDQTVINTAGEIGLSATDKSRIKADAGGVSIAISRASQGFGGAIAFGVSAAINNIQETVLAFADATVVTSATAVRIESEATPSIEAVTWAGSLAGGASGTSGLALTGAGAGSGNTIALRVESTMSGSSTIAASGDVTLSATDSATITANAGGVALDIVLGGSGSNFGVSIGAAASVNDISGDTKASITDSSVTSGDLSLTASSTSTIDSLTIGIGATLAAGESNGVTFAGAGAGSGNTVSRQIEASVVDSSLVSNNVNLTATDGTKITADGGAGAAALSGSAGANGFSIGFGAAVAINGISNSTQAILDNTMLAAAGHVALDASSTAAIETTTAVGNLNLSLGGGQSAVAFGGAGAGSGNDIENRVIAAIKNGSVVTTTVGGDASVSASDATTIEANAGAGALSAAVGANSGLGFAFGAAAATNDVRNTTQATINAAQVSATGQIRVVANSTVAVDVLTIGVGGALGGGVGTAGVAFAGGGAGSGNTLNNTVEASITAGASATGTALNVTAGDDASITADAGAGALAAAGGGDGGVSVGIGASIAVNDINDSAEATIDQSTTNIGGDVRIASTHFGTIESTAAVGSLSGSGGSTGGVAGAGAGASSQNHISNSTLAQVVGGSLTTTGGGTLTLDATDSATIDANAGAGALTIAGGGTGGIGVTVGAALVTNTVMNTVQASVDDAVITSAGDVRVAATSAATIDTLALGVTGALTGGGTGGISLAGAGAGSSNAIDNTVEASLKNNASVDSGGAVNVSASDTATITADSGGVAFAISGGGEASASVSVGASTSGNEIGSANHTLAARIDQATVSAAGAVGVDATSSATIDALAFGGAVSVSISGGGAVAGTGAGAAATNSIDADVDAAVVNGAILTAGGDVTIAAQDLASITTNAVAGSLSISGSAGGSASVSVSAAPAVNDIQNMVRGRVDNATVTTSDNGDVSITTASTPSIDALAVAATVSGSVSEASLSFSGGGASANNTIANQIEASISNGSSVSADGGIAVAATDDASLDANVGSGALSFAVIGASVAVSITDNTLSNSVSAFVQDASASAANGDLSVTADTTADSSSTSVATSFAISIGGAGFGGDASSTDTTVVQAYADGAQLSAPSGDVTVSSSSNLDMASESYGFGGGIVVVGVLLSDVSLQRTTRSYIGEASTVTGISLTVEAVATDSATGTTLNGDISALGGEGAQQTVEDQSVVEAYIGPPTGSAGGGSPAVVNTTSGDIRVSATLTTDAQAESNLGSFGILANGVGGVVEATVTPTVSAYIGDAAQVTAAGAGDLNVEAGVTGSASVSGFGLAVSGGLAGSGLGLTATLSPDVSAFTGTNALLSARNVSLVTRLNVDETNGDPLAGKKADASGTVGSGGLIAAAAGVNSQAIVSPTLATLVGEQTTVVATGDVVLATLSYQAATGVGNSDQGAGLIGVGTTLVATNVAGSTTTRVDGIVRAAGQVAVSSVVTTEATSDGQANGGSLLGVGEGTNVQATIGESGQSMVETAVGGQITADDDVTIQSLVTTNAKATSSGVSISGVVAVGSMPAGATVQPTIDTDIESGAAVVSNGGGVLVRSGHNFDPQQNDFLDDKLAQVEASIASGSAGVDVNDTTITADARALVGASVESTASVSAPSGDVSILALSSNRADATMKNDGGSGLSFTNLGKIVTTANGSTIASAAGEIFGATAGSPGAVNVNITAQASDIASGDLDQSGGAGLVSVANSEVNSTSSPTVSATAGGAILASGNVSIDADSFTDADATIRAKSGGSVDVSTYDATVTITPAVSATIASNAVVQGEQSVNLNANHGQPADLSDGKFDAQSDVSTANDTITFSKNHGLLTGSTVTYDNLGQPDIAGLQNGRDYGVIVASDTALQIGDSFQADNSTVDIATDSIRFGGPHNFKTGDRVLYDANGGTVIGGLTDNGPYLVEVVDATTIRLIEPNNVPPAPHAFAGTDIATDIITIASHGFSAGQGVTYLAATPATFGSGLVDVDVQTVAGVPVSISADPGANNIYLGVAAIAMQGFQAGDTVTYTSSNPAMPIGGLTSGDRYVIIDDPAKPGEIQLADPATPTVPLALDTTGLSTTVTHALLDVEDQPIGPLVSQQTYYVSNATANTFQLAPTAADALAGANLIALDPTDPLAPMNVLTGTRNELGTMGIDLTSVGNGTQHLVVELTATSTGTQQLLGIGGAQSVSNASSDDGIATASVSSGGGGIIEVSSADTRANSTPVTRAIVGEDARVEGLDITMDASSSGNVAGSSANSGGGFVSVETSSSSVSVANSATATIDDGAALAAINDLDLTTTASQFASVESSTDGGAFAALPDANATAHLDYTSEINIQDATLAAGNTLTANAQSDLNASADATANGSGVGSGASANNSSGKGVFIGKNSGAVTKTLVDTGAQLVAQTVNLQATVTSMLGRSNATAEGSGVGGNSQAIANLEINDVAEVELRSGSEVSGTQVNLNATHENIDLKSHSNSRCDCGAGADDSTANTDYQSTSQINAKAGSVITTAALDVQANQFVTQYKRDEDHGGGFLVFGSHDRKGSYNARRDIEWNATVRLPTNPDPALLVDANGLVVTLDDVTLNGDTIHQGDTVPINTTIFVDDIINDQGGTAAFSANRLAEMNDKKPPVGVIAGSQAEFDFNRTLDTIQLTNASDRDMTINDIRVYFTPSSSDQEVRIDVQQDSGFAFDVINDFALSEITIANSHPTAAPLLSLNGLIDNPIGTTTATNISGPIVAGPTTAPTGIVRANRVILEATAGDLGQLAGNPLVVQLVQSAGRPTIFIADAGQDAVLDIQGLLRDASVTQFQPILDRVTAGGEANLVLRQGLLQTTIAAAAEGIRVHETSNVGLQPKGGCSDSGNDNCFNHNGGLYPPIASPQFADSSQPPRTSTVETHWPPSSGDPPPPASELGLFGSGNTTIDTTYAFDGQFTFDSATDTRRVQAAGDIQLIGCGVGGCVGGDNLVHLLGNVDLTSFANLPVSTGGVLSVATNGSIDLTEVAVPTGSNRSLRVGTIISTADSVRLTVPDTTAAGEDLTLFDNTIVTPNGSLVSAATSVAMRIGDNVFMAGDALSPAGSSQINAGATIVIAGDFNDADPGVGTVIDLRGQITGNISGLITDPSDLKMVALVTGQEDADIVSLTNVTAGTGTTVQTNGQDDTIQVGSNAQVDVSVIPPVATNQGGVLHAVQALLTVDGGLGNGGLGDDRLSADDSGDGNPDSGVLTFDTITGFQMSDGIVYQQIEDLTITLGQAGDTLDVDSTNATTDSKVFGNGGEDTFNVSKLPALPLVGNACLQTTDTVDCIQGILRVTGGDDYDTMNVVDTGQTSSRSGTLTAATVTGLNMGPDGIEYMELEAVDILLGEAGDTFTIESTAPPQAGGNTTISAVHGGGGQDTITVTGGGGLTSPLVIYGDFTGTGVAAGDTIDASASSEGVMVDGNDGDDLIIGSQAGDNLAGSSGNDSIQGQDGSDNLIGDSGFEVDLRTRVTTTITSQAAGQDLLEGQNGVDRLFGDHAVLTPVAGALLVTTSVELATFETVNESVGDEDRALGGAGDDFVLGGQGNDTVFGNEGHDWVLGDNGRFDQTATGAPPVIHVQYTPQRNFGGNDNIFGDSGNSDDPAGNDVLVDGPADDELDGGPGDDTFRLLPGNEAFAAGSRDFLSDIRGDDTLDFGLAMLRGDCTTPATATDLCGIMIDMDLLGYTDAAFSQAGPDARQPIAEDAPQQVPQDLSLDDRVSLLRIGDFGQTRITPSPFENVIGTSFNDTFWIEALTTGGDIPENGPPVSRNVNGNPPVVGDAAVPPGDKLWFDGEGQQVLDTGFSLTAVGIGTVTYQSIESLCVFRQAPRIVDDGDDTYIEDPTTAVANISPIGNWNPISGIGFGGDYRYHQPQTPPGPNTATWSFEGVTPGKYRVSVTYPSDPSHPLDGTIVPDAPYTVFDDDFLLARRSVDQRLGADDFFDQGVFWEDLGIFETESHTLNVRLSDDANGQVMADAVRIEAVADGPSLRVLEHPSRRAILDDISVVDMATTIDAPVTQTFVIQNQGDATLVVSEIEIAGDGAANYGVTPTASALPVTIAPGETLSFDITLNAATASGYGTFPAEVRIVSNDMSTSVPRKPGAGASTNDPSMDVSPFTFQVAGWVSTQRIIDDGDADFSVAGVWQGPGGAGFNGDDLHAPADGRGARAIWQFDGLPDGAYRVSTSYDAEIGGATMAPFTVSNSSGLLGTVSIDQTQSPQALGGFADAGAFWVDLGGPYELTGGALIVNLLDTAGQPDRFVLADAVRIERVFGDAPDILVDVDGQAVALGGTVDFGAVYPDSPVVKTFSVTNGGIDSLIISEPIQVPPGFELVEFDGQTPTGELTATAPTTFKLRMEGSAPGDFNGQVVFANNDPDENPFSFFVTGHVISSRIIDDQDTTGFSASAGFAATGTGLSANQGFRGEVHFADGDALSPSESATWTFEGLTDGGQYLVSATWSPFTNRATDAPFTIGGIDDTALDPPDDNDGSVTVVLNQQRQPSDREANGTLFDDLGIFTVKGTTLTVSLSNDANGQVIADAIRLQPIAEPRIVVEQDGRVLQSGYILQSEPDRVDFGSATPGSAGDTIDRVFTIRNEGNRPMALGAPTLPVGFVLVGDFPTTVAVGGSADFVVGLRRDAAGAYAGVLLIPADDVGANPFRVELVGNILDTGTIIDNSDGMPGFSSVGFTTFSGQGRGGTVQGAPAGDGSRTATFAFSVAPGLYRVSATWSTYYTRATDAPFSVFDGATSGSPLNTTRIDQQVSPDSFADAGSPWRDLAIVRITSGTLNVQLSDDANGDVVADAIRIEPLPQQPVVAILDSFGNPISNGGSFDFGTVNFGSSRTEVFTVLNLGAAPLDLGELRLPADFQLATPLGATTLAPFDGAASNLDQTTFQVRFAPLRVDRFLGALRLSNNDSSENPFQFLLEGNVQAAVTIIDDGDPIGPPGYHDTGFQAFSGQGFDGDVRQSTPGAGNTATWTFDVVANTTYRVSATWTAYFNRATNAPYTIGDIAGGEDVVLLVDQRVAPGDFNDADTPWRDLSIVRTSGATLTVSLSDDANGIVIADAIRIEQLPDQGPAILVSDGPIHVPDDVGRVTLSTVSNANVTRTFNVVNMGTAPLMLNNGSLQTSLAGIAGFQLVGGGFGSTTVAPGDFTTFTVELDAAVEGTFGGAISFDHSDPTFSPYDFTINGVVRPATAIIDNGDPIGPPGYGETGNWQVWSGQGFNGDVSEAQAGGAVETATYTFDVAAGGVYQVAATWTPYSNRATDAPYAILGVSQPATVSVNQRLAPNDFQEAGASWEQLGAFTASGTTLSVTLSGSTTGNVIADAVRIERLTDPEIQVLAGTAEIANGTGVFDFGAILTGASGTTQAFTVKNVGAADLVLQPITVTGDFSLDTAVHPDFTTNQVVAVGGEVQFEVAMGASTSGSKQGAVSFGTNDLDEGPYNFDLTGQVADAIIIDDGDAIGYSDSANMQVWAQGFEGDVREAVGGGAAQSASYTFADLPAGTYRISTTWTPFSNRATNAPYTINGGAVVPVNQRLAPANPASTLEGTAVQDPNTGVFFADLDSSFAFGGGTIVVGVSDSGANGNVIIDAVRVERLNPLRVEPYAGNRPVSVAPLQSEQIAIDLDRAIQQWAMVDPSATESLRDVTVIVKDLPGSLLGLGSRTTPTIWLDADAAGHGWQLDTREFRSERELLSVDRIDLLSVITHELGHVLGLPDIEASDIELLNATDSIMSGRERLWNRAPFE